MRIALISVHASPLAMLGGEDTGGQNIHVAELSKALVQAGHEVRVYTRRTSSSQPEAVETAAGFTVVHVPVGPPSALSKNQLLPYMKDFGGWLAQSWSAGSWQPDVMHAHFWMSGIAAVTARHRIPAPVVLTYHALGTVKRRHQGAADTSPPDRVAFERALGRAVDRVIAQCRDEVEELRSMGVRPDRISLVSSGVDSEVFCPAGPAEPREAGLARILTVGRLVARKGYADVIRALRGVPDAECVVVGGPPASELDHHGLACELRALARSCRVDDRVRLVGAVPPGDMPAWYRSADILASAPWYEPFGLVPLEAMACGVPVVGTTVGGLTDTVVHGVTGALVPARNPRALGIALRQLLRDEPRRYAYGVAALDRARQRYSWPRAAEQLSEVYAAVGRERTEVAM